MKKNKMIAMMLALVMSLSCLTACGQPEKAIDTSEALASGGVLVLRVNPEIAVTYDAEGMVTAVTARNDDGGEILNGCEGLIGREARAAVTALVEAIGEAGYFVEEIEGGKRRITLEIEAGSRLPHDNFLDDVVADIRDCVNKNDWKVPMDVENESDYGVTDYDDTDYGPNNDGVTDYGVTDYDDTDYGPNNDGVTDYGVTDYDDTDYGPNNDGVTDYSATDYDDTDYGPGNDGVTDYSATDYDDTDYGVTDYDDTDYDDSDYNETDYDDTNYDDSDYGSSDYDD